MAQTLTVTLSNDALTSLDNEPKPLCQALADLQDYLRRLEILVTEQDDFEERLSCATAAHRIELLVEKFGADKVAVLTSFGVQSGVMLGLIAEACPDVRVIFVDTQGPMSARDLAYGKSLIEKLGLKNLTVARSSCDRKEFAEAMGDLGLLHDNDEKQKYFKLQQDVFKVTPLNDAVAKHGITCLLSGVRRGQTIERDSFKFALLPSMPSTMCQDPSISSIGLSRGHPILDWTDEQVLTFLREKGLPEHPELKGLVAKIKGVEEETPSGSTEPISSSRGPLKKSETYDQERAIVTTQESITKKTPFRRQSSQIRSQRRGSRGSGQECGIHAAGGGNEGTGSNNIKPPLPNLVIAKPKCKFCRGAKQLLSDQGIEYTEAPLDFFGHLVPSGTRTVPVIYLENKLVGGYGSLCEHLGVEDELNNDK